MERRRTDGDHEVLVGALKDLRVDRSLDKVADDMAGGRSKGQSQYGANNKSEASCGWVEGKQREGRGGGGGKKKRIGLAKKKS